MHQGGLCASFRIRLESYMSWVILLGSIFVLWVVVKAWERS